MRAYNTLAAADERVLNTIVIGTRSYYKLRSYGYRHTLSLCAHIVRKCNNSDTRLVVSIQRQDSDIKSSVAIISTTIPDSMFLLAGPRTINYKNLSDVHKQHLTENILDIAFEFSPRVYLMIMSLFNTPYHPIRILTNPNPSRMYNPGVA